MKCTLEEAFKLFFIPWHKDRLEVVATIHRGMGGSERGWIEETDLGRKSITFRAKSWEGKGRVIWFEGAEFSYEDGRAGIIPELVERKWSCFVLAEYPDGRSILFSLPRDDEEVDTDAPLR